MHWLFTVLLIAQVMLPLSALPGQAAGPVVTDRGVESEFGKQITFHIQVSSLESVDQLNIYITPEGQATVWQPVELTAADSQGRISQLVDVRQLSLYPFSTIYYRYEAVLKNGSKQQGATGSFEYQDNRFSWQTFESGLFQIHWYGDDTTLGQMIANIASEGLKASQELLDVTPPSPLRIYAYTSSRDLQSALQLTNTPWVAGHAAPEMGLVLISVPSGPEKKLELERQIPHEIMHILQYQVTGPNFERQPIWLMEGMASLVEIYPNPDYRTVLESSTKAGTLIPIQSLCASFPRDAGGAFQSYAQAESFVRFLYNRYGATGLRSLIDQYENGLGCEEGFAASTGTPISQAERRWQQESLGVNVGGLVLSNLLPYLLVGLVILGAAAITLIPIRSGSRMAG